jgi:predicted metalloprotease with PDZ domain
VEYSNGASLALNEIMEKAFGTNKFLYALADNPSQVTQSMEKVAVDRYTAKIDALTAQMKNIDNTTVVSANAISVPTALKYFGSWFLKSMFSTYLAPVLDAK